MLLVLHAKGLKFKSHKGVILLSGPLYFIIYFFYFFSLYNLYTCIYNFHVFIHENAIAYVMNYNSIQLNNSNKALNLCGTVSRAVVFVSSAKREPQYFITTEKWMARSSPSGFIKCLSQIFQHTLSW
jgi:hypothetical protein